MNGAKIFYTTRLSEIKALYKKQRKKLVTISLLRLFLFAGIIALGIYLRENTFLFILDLFFGGSIFLFLVKKYFDQKDAIRRSKNLIKILNQRLENLKGNFSCQNSGKQYMPKVHDFAGDMDLFGEGSLFEKVNTTSTNEGETYLANLFLANDISDVIQKQLLVKDFTNSNDFRLNFAGEVVGDFDYDKVSKAYDYIENYQEIKFKFGRVIPRLFSGISLMLIALFSFDFLSFTPILIWGIFGLAVSGLYFKKVNDFCQKTGLLEPVLNTQVSLLTLLQTVQFESDLGKSMLERFNSDDLKPDQIVKRFSSIVSRLDQRNNMFFGFVANALFLWDINQMLQVGSWLSQYKELWLDWRAGIAEVDAYIALGDFAFHNENYIYPTLSESRLILADNLGHPLIDSEKLVSNSVSIDSENLWIITGANMAGKSTFLRAIGLGIIMSNMGMPIPAESYSYQPIKLISSMRTSDSLMEESSYFHAELYRLKYVLDHTENSPYLVLLDEILKGTNSVDKAEGSKQFLKKLNKGNATTLVATHDLSLCELSNDSQGIYNYFFEAVIESDELYFDYKLRSGICKNMNASYLLKKMNLVD